MLRSVHGNFVSSSQGYPSHSRGDRHALPREVERLMCDCWERTPEGRPSMADIAERLRAMAPMCIAAAETCGEGKGHGVEMVQQLNPLGAIVEERATVRRETRTTSEAMQL